MSEPRTDDGLPDASTTSHSQQFASDAAKSVPAQPLIERHSLSRADIDRILSVRKQSVETSQEVAPPSGSSSLDAPVGSAGSPFNLDGVPAEMRDSLLATISKNQGKIPLSSGSAKITVVEDRSSSGQEAVVQVMDDAGAIEVAVTESAPKAVLSPSRVPQRAAEASQPSSGPEVHGKYAAQPGATPQPQRVGKPGGAVQISPGRAQINLAPKTPVMKTPQNGAVSQPVSGKAGGPGPQAGKSFRTGPVRVSSTSGQTMVFFRPGKLPPAAVKVDEKSNIVRVGNVPPSVAKKIEDKMSRRAAEARAAQVEPNPESRQQAGPPAVTNSPSASVQPEALPDPREVAPAQSPESAIRREEAAKELIAAPATEVSPRGEAPRSGGVPRASQKPGRAIPAGSKGGGKRGKYKKPPIVTKPVLLLGVCVAALVAGMVWHSKNNHSVTQSASSSHVATDAMPLPDDADSLPQADIPVHQSKSRGGRVPAPKRVADRASLPPMPPPNDNIWKTTSKPTPATPDTLAQTAKPGDAGLSRPSAQPLTGSDALPKGMVPASAVSAQPPQPEMTPNYHSVTVGGVKMYVPTDGSVGNLDNLGIDTDSAQAIRLGEGKGGCETSASSQ